MKNDLALFGVLVLLGLLIGFLIGREFPRETSHERECRAWAEKTVRDMNDPDRNRFGLLFGACMKGFQQD
jgi:hypothetical protein